MYDWRKVIHRQSDTMQSAIETLNREALRIVMVVDNRECIVGTVTDGDIRRGLLRHLTMEAPLVEFMSKSPTVVSVNENRQEILKKMQASKLFQIPIIDEQRKIVGLETLQHLLEKTRYDNPVFLMAGGLGKRLRPLTDHTPKPLLRVGSKPILQTILEQFIAVGFHNFFISTYYKAEMVREHFGNGSNWGVTIQYVHEEKPLGTAGSLGLLPAELPNLPIVMMNGDLLTKLDFEELLSFHDEYGAEATMCVREYDFQVPYGVIKADGNRVLSIIEKPVHKFFVNAGIYVLSPSILGAVDGCTFLDMPTMLEQQIGDDRLVNVFPIHEYWLDIGQMEQFDQAQNDFNVLYS